MTITFNPKITEAGKAAAIDANNNGLQLALTSVKFGTGNYDPIGTETALSQPVKTVTLASGGLIAPNQLRMSALWHSDTDAYPIYEVGFYAGSVLFAIWSAGGGANPPLGYKSAGIDFVLFNDLLFSQVPAGSVTVTVDGGQSAMLAALGAHEQANNAHPQYQRIETLVDAQSGIWCGLAGGTANNLILQLPASQTGVTAYAQGQRLVFKAAAANTGAVTAKMKLPDGTVLGVKTVTKTGTTALNAGDITANAIYELFYDGLNGAEYQLSGGVGGAASRSVTEYTISDAQALANKTAPLSLPASYTVGLVDVLMQGRGLSTGDYGATDGANIVFPAGTFVGGEAIRILSWSSFNVANAAQFRAVGSATLTQNQGSIPWQYTPNMVDVFVNGAKYSPSDITATDGLTINFNDPSKIADGDILDVVTYAPYAVANAVDLVTQQTITPQKTFLNLKSGNAQLPNAGAFSLRNKLINAAASINQRGYVSGTATASANQYTVDRWRVNIAGQNLAFVASGVSNQMTAPVGGLSQVIEGVNIEGGTYCLSWTGTATAQVNGAAVTNGGNFTLPANTNATVNFIGGTVLNPQLELGTMPSPFEYRHISVEVMLCQRYFRKSYEINTAPATATSLGNVNLNVGTATTNILTYMERFSPPMRAAPSITTYDLAGVAGKAWRGNNGAASYVSDTSSNGANIGAGLGASYAAMQVHYTADAEL